MKIRTKLLFSSTVLILLLGLLAFSNRRLSEQVQDEMLRAQVADQFARTVFDLLILTDYYLAYQDATTETRMLAKLEQLVARTESNDGIQSVDVTRLAITSLNQMIPALVSLYAERASLVAANAPIEDLERSYFLEERFAGLIRTDIEKVSTTALSISTDAYQRAAAVQSQSDQISFALTFLVILLAGGSALVVSRSIAHPVEQLAQSIQTIDQAGTGQRLTVQGQDEIGFLATAFNRLLDRQQDNLAALRESEQRYRSLFDNSMDGLLSADDEGNCVDANPAISELLGYSREEMLQLNIRDINQPEFRHEFKTNWIRFISAGRTKDEYAVICKDGSSRMVEYRAVANVQPGLHLSSMRDISDRIQSERRLRRSEERFRSFIEHSPDAIHLVDVATNTTQFLNRESFCGYSKAELEAPGSVVHAIHPDDADAVHVQWLQAIEGRTDHIEAVEYRLQRKDGEWEWIQARIGVVERDDANQAIRVLIFLTLITERKEIELQLAQQANLLAHVSDATIVTDTEFRVLGWNKAAEEMYGWSAEEVRGKSMGEILSTQYPNRSREEALASFQKHGSWSGEALQHSKDGTPISVLSSVALVKDKDGRPVSVLVVNRNITRLKQTEEALRTSESRYRLLVESSHDLIWEVDSKGVFTFMNPVAKEIYGWDPEEMIGWEAEQLMDLEAVRNVVRVFQEALVSGSDRVHYENRVRDRYGNQVILDAHAVVRRDSQGNFTGATGTSQDITERKRAEQALKERETLYRTLVETIPYGVQETDEEGKITYANRAFHEIYGYEDGELLGTSIYDLPSTTQERAELVQYLRHLTAEQPAPTPYEGMSRTKDGRLRHVHVTWNYKRDSEANVVGFVSVITDISERHRQEEARAIRARQQEEVATLGQFALTGTPLPTLFKRAVESVASVFRVEYAKILELQSDKQWMQLVAGVGWRDGLVGKALVSAGEESQAGFTLLNREPVIVKNLGKEERFDGPPLLHEHQVVSGISVIIGDPNDPFGVMGAHSTKEREFSRDDINFFQAVANILAEAIQSRRTENQLRRLNVELEVRVQERTEELARAVEQAQAADRLKSAFLATMSHELRTPLNSIIGFTGVLLQELAGPLNPEQSKQLGMTRDSARHLLALINDVLDISRIEAGEMEVAHQSFDMRAAIESAVRQLAPMTEKKGLSMGVAIDSTVGTLVGDRRRVEQILINLLSNAVKFTEQGRIELKCYARNGWIETHIADTGPGIRESDMVNLFQPFQQLESGLARRHEGTGLGLSICRNLVQLLGGEIWVNSEWGKGSTFAFTLPLTQVARSASHSKTNHSATKHSATKHSATDKSATSQETTSTESAGD